MARQYMVYHRRWLALNREMESALGQASRSMLLAQAEMGQASLTEALLLSAAGREPDCSTAHLLNLQVPEISYSSPKTGIGYGFAFTSLELDGAVQGLQQLLPKLYELAQVNKICEMLSDEMERTRRRVNALEYVMIPQMEQTIRTISMKLEDNERSTLTRLQKVKEMLARQQG